MVSPVRFSALVRRGLRFRRALEEAKRSLGATGFDWYPYDTFANLFYLQRLMNDARLALEGMAGAEPVLDLGAGDGALSFFFESLGYPVVAVDHSGTSINQMRGIRALAETLNSRVRIRDLDLDARFELDGKYGLALFLGTLYHLKNPFYVLELLSKHARFCFLSTRVARVSLDRQVRLEHVPVAYLLDAEECNADATNYWILSPAGLALLAKRAGWRVRASVSSRVFDSDPVSAEGDERMFLLLSRPGPD